MTDSPLHKTVELRQDAAERLNRLIIEAADAYKEFAGLTADLHQLAFRANKRTQQGYVTLVTEPVHGLSSYPERVRALIEWQLFGTGDGRTIDLSAIVMEENDRAARFIQQMQEVAHV